MATTEFWINGEAQNMLKGVAGDTTNPLMLTDEYIVNFLLRIPDARVSFDRLYPTMLPAEQARLTVLRNTAASSMQLDQVERGDIFQHSINTARIVRGGEWAPPPFRG